MVNMEVLRILAMAMVVSLHYLAKGEILPKLSVNPLGAVGHTAWFLETLSICAVNTYVLISAYFLVNTGFRCKRVLSLICQVLFYTILTPVVLSALGFVSFGNFTTYAFLQNILPVQMLQYWFVSAYVLLFLFSPVLNAAVHAMNKVQLLAVIIILLIMESVLKTLLPVRLELDNLGYDALWFMVVYLIAAYIRLYGISFLDHRGRGFWFYFAGLAVMYGMTMALRQVYLKTGSLEYFMEAAYGYNHLLNIFCAVSLFYGFLSLRNPDGKNETGLQKLILLISPCTFGIYLLHEQNQMRYLWQFWLGADKCTTALSLLGHWILAILAVMAVGTLIDLIRRGIFSLCGKVIAKTPLPNLLWKVDNLVNGRA